MIPLVDQARALEKEARANLAKVPVMARAVYPEYVQAGEQFCDRLSQLVRDLEEAERLGKPVRSI